MTRTSHIPTVRVELGADGPLRELPDGVTWTGTSVVSTINEPSHLLVSGYGDGDAVRDGDGAGDAVRDGTGDGDAVRDGGGAGNAVRFGTGTGDAARDGDGNGRALRFGDGASTGSALCFGTGDGDAAHAVHAADDVGAERRHGTGETVMLIGVICYDGRAVGDVGRCSAAGRSFLIVHLFRDLAVFGERSFSLGDFDNASWDEDLLGVACRWMDTKLPFSGLLAMRSLGGYVEY